VDLKQRGIKPWETFLIGIVLGVISGLATSSRLSALIIWIFFLLIAVMHAVLYRQHEDRLRMERAASNGG
jgi:hypothetical protein